MIELLNILFILVKEESKSRKKSSSKIGHEFEDKVFQIIWESARNAGYQALPARYTLALPTVSGNVHQFDVGYKDRNTFHLFECKRRKMSPIENVYYFNAKILDYLLRNQDFSINGIYISSSEIGDSSIAYALSYGMTFIGPNTPPIQILQSLDNKLNIAINSFRSKLPQLKDIIKGQYEWKIDPKQLCEMYKFYVRRCASNI